MESPPLSASPTIPDVGEGGYDYSAILFMIFIPILLYFIVKYIIDLTKPPPIQEGNVFDDIADIFDKIENIPNMIQDAINDAIKTITDGFMSLVNSIWEGINSIWKEISSVWEQLACPMRIIEHFDLCLGNYGGDVLLYILHGLIYAITFIVYCLFYLIFYSICFFTNQLCIPFNPSQMCPSRHNIVQAIDYISVKGGYRFFDKFQFTTGNTFFYRDERNMNLCYCIKPIVTAFDPVVEKGIDEFKLKTNMNSRAPLIIALCLCAILFTKRFIR